MKDLQSVVNGKLEDRPVSIDELLESVRRLRAQDADGFRRLVDEISKDTSLGLAKDVVSLAKSLAYEDAEVLEAVDNCGLVRTFGFLRREAERRKAEPRPIEPLTRPRLM